jgi:hypothetical protein
VCLGEFNVTSQCPLCFAGFKGKPTGCTIRGWKPWPIDRIIHIPVRSRPVCPHVVSDPLNLLPRMCRPNCACLIRPTSQAEIGAAPVVCTPCGGRHVHVGWVTGQCGAVHRSCTGEVLAPLPAVCWQKEQCQLQAFTWLSSGPTNFY